VKKDEPGVDRAHEDLTRLPSVTRARPGARRQWTFYFGRDHKRRPDGTAWRLGGIGVASRTGIPLGSSSKLAGSDETEDTLLVYGMNGEPSRSITDSLVRLQARNGVPREPVSSVELFELSPEKEETIMALPAMNVAAPTRTGTRLTVPTFSVGWLRVSRRPCLLSNDRPPLCGATYLRPCWQRDAPHPDHQPHAKHQFAKPSDHRKTECRIVDDDPGCGIEEIPEAR
jgi:hypothetical protein